MRMFLRNAVAAVAAVVMVGAAAQAADLGGAPVIYPQETYAPRLFNWTGFYVGANLGGAWGNTTLSEDITGASWDMGRSGVAGGFQAGYNYQFSNIVLGAEWNIDWTSMGVSGPGILVNSATLQGSANTNWVTTLAGRVGYAADNWLFYGKGGWAWVNNSATITNLANGNSISVSQSNNGWLAGVGLEYAFTRNWTGRIEYDYIGLDSVSGAGILANQNITGSRDIQMVTFGINYKF